MYFPIGVNRVYHGSDHTVNRGRVLGKSSTVVTSSVFQIVTAVPVFAK